VALGHGMGSVRDLTESRSDTSEMVPDAVQLRSKPSAQSLDGGKHLGGTAVQPKVNRPADKAFAAGYAFRFDTLYRAVLGCLAVPALVHTVGEQRADWALVPFLLAGLLVLRIVPILLRRLVPFKESAQRAWAERRQLGRRYDSYQWQKLLSVGIGLALYALYSGETTAVRLAISSTCLLSGALGLAWWRLMAAPRHQGRR
jgi:hypothetical protein